MAARTRRTRYIKPEFFDDSDIGELSFGARILYIGLWTQMDRDGLMKVDHKEIRKNVFGYDEEVTLDVLRKMLQELLDLKFIYEGHYLDTAFYYCPTLRVHQKFHKDEKSKHLIPEDILATWCEEDATRVLAPLEHPAKSTGNLELGTCNGELVTGNGVSLAPLRAPTAPLAKASVKNSEVIKLWCENYKAKYGYNYKIVGKDHGCIRALAKDFTLEQLAYIFPAFLKMANPYYEKRSHALGVLLSDIHKIAGAAQTGVDPDDKHAQARKEAGLA